MLNRISRRAEERAEALPVDQEARDEGVATAAIPVDSLPKELFVGYYAHISKADLVRHLRGYAQKHCQSPKTARYQLRAFQSGYLFELHDGGSAGGVLSSVIEDLMLGRSPVVRASQGRLRIVESSTGITTYWLKEEDDSSISDDIRYADRLKPLFSTGIGFLFSGALVFLSGLAVFSAGTFVHILAAEAARPPDFQVHEKVSPLQGLEQLDKQPMAPNQYIERLEYVDGQWAVQLNSTSDRHSNRPAGAVEELDRILERGELE